MSTTRNDEAQAQKGGEFHPARPRDEPPTTKGHQPGKLVGNDTVPEFGAKTMPPGSAPTNATYQPNTSMPDDPNHMPSDHPAAGNIGSTSADVHTGLGHPGSGMTSQEMHSKTQQRQGVEGAGASHVKQSDINHHDPKFAHHRAEDKDEAVIGRGNVGGPAAEEREPEPPQTVATENKLPRS